MGEPPVTARSLAQLRARYAQEALPPPRVLAALEADPRRGVRALAAQLRRRRERAREERRRRHALLRLERRLRAEGAARVAGVDEAGVGPLAGPVVAAAVILPPEAELLGVDDSKQIPAARRSALAESVRRHATAWALGVASPHEIDRWNVYHASLLAMRRAVEALAPAPDALLVDARRIPEVTIPQHALPKGDAEHRAIAAASLLAKTHRDALMVELARRHPGYGFARHKGYGTPEHRAALRARGPCPAHRRSFAAVREAEHPRLPLG